MLFILSLHVEYRQGGKLLENLCKGIKTAFGNEFIKYAGPVSMSKNIIQKIWNTLEESRNGNIDTPRQAPPHDRKRSIVHAFWKPDHSPV